MAISVMWWSSQRRRERELFYRYELMRLMIERYENDPDKVLSWQRDQEFSDWQRRRDGLHLCAWVLILGGTGALVGLRFPTSEDSLFGWIPIAVGLAIVSHLTVSRRRPGVSPSIAIPE